MKKMVQMVVVSLFFSSWVYAAQETPNFRKINVLSEVEKGALNHLSLLLFERESKGNFAVIEASLEEVKDLLNNVVSVPLLSQLSQVAYGRNVLDRSDVPLSYREISEAEADNSIHHIFNRHPGNLREQAEELNGLHEILEIFGAETLEVPFISIRFQGQVSETEKYREEYHFVLVKRFHRGHSLEDESVYILVLN